MSAFPDTRSAAMSQLAALLGKRLTTNLPIREQHGRDEGYITPIPPDAVAFPESTEEVQTIARICFEHRIPMIPFGVGTSLEGQVIPTHGGLSIDFSGMNRILELNAEDMDVRLQPGVTRRQLNEYLRDQGLFFPVDPGADATLGGMASTRASGTGWQASQAPTSSRVIRAAVLGRTRRCLIRPVLRTPCEASWSPPTTSASTP